MKSVVSIAALMAASFLVLDASAQYARTVGDTLRYVETTDVELRVETPQGTIPLGLLTESTIEMTRVAADTLRAWYVELDVKSESPTGDANPDASALYGAPFVIRMDERGHTQVVSAPESPESLSGLYNAERQFDEFFLVLPEDELTVGYSWTYDVGKTDSTADGANAFTKRGELTVVGDTLIDGVRGLKITGALDATLMTSAYVPAQGITVHNAFSGVEENVFVFSPEEGRLLLRTRTATLSGTSTYEGTPMPMSMEQEISYASEFRLVP